MITFQDFEKIAGKEKAVSDVISDWKSRKIYQNAILADTYDRQENAAIMAYSKMIRTISGRETVDVTTSNNKICSNFFKRLNTQRNTYLLGNGVTFEKANVKKQLGNAFDTILKNCGYFALIHGVSFLYYTKNGCHIFKATEFAPVFDEETGDLMAGVRFWKIDDDHPTFAVLYEKDGFTRFKAEKGSETFSETDKKREYIQKVQYSNAYGEEVIGGENYTALPIVPVWGSRLHQSTLVGMQHDIDCFDMVKSGFANDLTDCAQIYWLLDNYGGMDDEDLARWLERLKLNHIAVTDSQDGGHVTPYTQEIPTQARTALLAELRSGIYENFGALDVHIIAAGSTNDHIDAAYQPMDEEADEFEFQIIEAIQKLIRAVGIEEDTPIFKRNRISNQKEQVEMLTAESAWLDEETIIKKLPNVTVDEVDGIMKRKEQEDADRLAGMQAMMNASNDGSQNTQNAI